jgi:hypothetical protein
MVMPTINKNTPPIFLKPLLWSYNFSKIDLNNDRKLIIISVINYGSLKEWRWLKEQYGKEEIKNTLKAIQATEIKPRARRLASLLFNISDDEFKYTPRGFDRRG